MRNRGWKAILLLVVGLVFASLGQFYFAYRQECVWDGLLFWSVAILALGLLLRRTSRPERPRSGWRSLSWLPKRPLRTLAVIGGTCLSLLAGWLARRRPAEADFGDLLWLWLIGVVWFLLAFIPSSRKPPNLPPKGRPKLELAGLIVLLLAALAVRAIDLEHIPANLGGDEGTQGVAALELVEPPLGNPFSTGWYAVPTMSFLAYGLAMRLFGETVAGLRALSALIGAATVLTTFLLARELGSRRVAWLAAIVLACSHYHIHFSRLGSNQIADGLFVTLALWLLIRGLRSERPVHFALAGAVIGLGWYSYFGARLVGIVVVLYLAWRAAAPTVWRRPCGGVGRHTTPGPPHDAAGQRFLARYGRPLLLLLGTALLVAAPLLIYCAGYPDALVSRARQVNIFISGWLEREQEISGRSAVSLMLQQFWKSISAFNYTLDPTFWYHPAIPLLDIIGGIFFVFGLAWTAARCRRPANGLLLIWFWLALLLGWVTTENPPSSQRMVIVAPALAIFVALGLERFAGLARRILGGRRTSWNAAIALLLASIAALNLGYYFLVYSPTRVYGNPTAEIATELARYLAQQDDDHIVYLHAAPFMYWDFGTLQFMARDVEGVNVSPVGGVQVESPEHDPSRGARFVFHPERLDELEAIRAQHPGGIETLVYSSADERLLYVLYEVSR